EQLSTVRPLWHRSVRHADLLIAACAEAHNLTLVHYDAAFDAISQLTRQPMRWVSGNGSL
ncbi:MAG: PIN domain-containing protein, partial [Candidatus Dormibacteraceae bacterium]